MKCRHDGKRTGVGGQGFTLIEVLTAIVVVIMITIACVTMFNQATDSVKYGTQHAEWNILGRAMSHLIASELEDAVFRTNSPSGIAAFDFDIEPDGTGVRFVRLRNDWPDESENPLLRAATEITYGLTPEHTVNRTTRFLTEGPAYAGDPYWEQQTGGPLGANVYGLDIIPDANWVQGVGLPHYADVFVELVSDEMLTIYEEQNEQPPAPRSDWVTNNAMSYQTRAYFRNRSRYR
jgi:prepilin-type N-terminal cleavage/methylation domain-containing protein